jgi:hypothetical protein
MTSARVACDASVTAASPPTAQLGGEDWGGASVVIAEPRSFLRLRTIHWHDFGIDPNRSEWAERYRLKEWLEGQGAIVVAWMRIWRVWW